MTWVFVVYKLGRDVVDGTCSGILFCRFIRAFVVLWLGNVHKMRKIDLGWNIQSYQAYNIRSKDENRGKKVSRRRGSQRKDKLRKKLCDSLRGNNWN